MRIYIIRHADPDYANDTITPQGRLEAEALAERMKKEGIHRIYSSPMGRSIETMKYTARALNMEARIEPWTQEHLNLSVELENQRKVFAIDLHGECIREDLSILDHKNWSKLPHFSHLNLREVYQNVVQESDKFIKRHGYERIDGRYRCIAPNEEKIAVFCHGGFGLTWIAHLLEIPLPLVWSGFWLPTTSVTTILFDKRTPNWAVPRCIGLGDISHLYAAGLEVLPRGIIANYY